MILEADPTALGRLVKLPCQAWTYPPRIPFPGRLPSISVCMQCCVPAWGPRCRCLSPWLSESSGQMAKFSLTLSIPSPPSSRLPASVDPFSP